MRYLTALLLGPLLALGLTMTAPAEASTFTRYSVGALGKHANCSTTMPTHGRAHVRCPDGYRRNLKPCLAEDSHFYCYWNAQVRGNGHGRSFIAITRVHYLRGVWHSYTYTPENQGYCRYLPGGCTGGYDEQPATWSIDNNGCLHYALVTDCLAGERVRGLR